MQAFTQPAMWSRVRMGLEDTLKLSHESKRAWIPTEDSRGLNKGAKSTNAKAVAANERILSSCQLVMSSVYNSCDMADAEFHTLPS